MAPKYEQLVQTLRQTLPQWYADGQRRLPCEQELAARFSVSRQTLRQALAVLEQDGLIEKRRGSGSFLPGGSQSERRIAVIATSLSDYIFPSLLKDIQACLSAQGFSVVIHATENSIHREARDFLQQLLLDPPAGILVESCKTALPNPNAELYQALRQRGLPMTFLHGSCRELSDAFCVGDDNYGGGYLLAGHLIRNGHQKNRRNFQIRRCGGRSGTTAWSARCATRGFSRSMKISSGSPASSAISSSSCRTKACCKIFLRQQLGGCTAVVCYNDEIAFHLIRTLLRAGKRVPEDVAVVSFDNSYYSTFPVSITSAGHEPHAIATRQPKIFSARSAASPARRPPAVDAVRPAERIIRIKTSVHPGFGRTLVF